MAGTPLNCPHCGNEGFRVLKQPRTLECLQCGRSCSFEEAAQAAQSHRDRSAKPPTDD
jgi:uncharacterized Zn finger protein